MSEQTSLTSRRSFLESMVTGVSATAISTMLPELAYAGRGNTAKMSEGILKNYAPKLLTHSANFRGAYGEEDPSDNLKEDNDYFGRFLAVDMNLQKDEMVNVSGIQVGEGIVGKMLYLPLNNLKIEFKRDNPRDRRPDITVSSTTPYALVNMSPNADGKLEINPGKTPRESVIGYSQQEFDGFRVKKGGTYVSALAATFPSTKVRSAEFGRDKVMVLPMQLRDDERGTIGFESNIDSRITQYEPIIMVRGPNNLTDTINTSNNSINSTVQGQIFIPQPVQIIKLDDSGKLEEITSAKRPDARAISVQRVPVDAEFDKEGNRTDVEERKGGFFRFLNR